jgi:A/G-specific adenine glycosylase
MNLDLPVSISRAKKKIENFAVDFLKNINAGDFNQAIMDLGSSICIPIEPKCEDCPVVDYCEAKKNHTQAVRPVIMKKKAIPLYQVVAAAICDTSGCYLLAKRPKGGMLPGLWEFPGGKVERGEDDPTALKREIREELNTSVILGDLIGSSRHAYTHFKVQVRTYQCTLDGKMPQALEAQELVWVKPEEMGAYAMGKVDRLISYDLKKHVQDTD